MRFLRRRALLVPALVAACVAAPFGPSRVSSLPWSEAPADRAVLEARGLHERGDAEAAMRLVDTVLQKDPRHVDALRLRQDIARERGRKGLLLVEVERMLAAAPDDALAHYLHGRIGYTMDDKRQSFERAAALAPESLWPWLGLAYAQRQSDPERALQLYSRLLDVTDAHPLVAIPCAQMLRAARRFDELQALYERLADDPRVPGVGALGLADVAIAQNDRDLAFASLLAALRVRPFDPVAQGLVRGWLAAGASEEQVARIFDGLRGDRARATAFATGDGRAVFAELLERHGQPHAALELLEALPVDARKPALRRLQRRLLAGVGDAAAVLALLRADTPRELVLAEPNQLRARWLALLDGSWGEDPLADAEAAEHFLRALAATGFLVEAEALAAVVLRRWPAAAAIATLRDELRAELVFEDGLKSLLYDGYRTETHGRLADVLAHLRELAQAAFGRDVVGDAASFHVPLVGDLLDPFTGGLADHLARYNRHLILGQRAGGVPEGMLLSRLSVRELPPEPELELPGRCYEVVTMDREVRSLSGVLGGDIAGVALLNHYMVDFDAVRDWAAGIADRRRIAASDGNASLADPLPEHAGLDPLDASHRLQVMSPVQDADLEAAVLDTIRHHERRHLVDSFRFLPIEQHLGRGLGLILRLGLSSAAVEAEMEKRAELASLALTPHTELSLAHIADFLADPAARSPHYTGFTELARDLSRQLKVLGVPAIAAAPSRWPQLDMALVRRAARELLHELD
ncbi:MAG: hypothetical protein U1E73_13595 [Planctomycetota bacterium]